MRVPADPDALALDYAASTGRARRSRLLIAVGVVSVTLGAAGILAHGLVQLLVLLGPFAPPQRPTPSKPVFDLFEVGVFYLSWASSALLLVAGGTTLLLWPAGLGRRLHLAYVAVQVLVSVGWAAWLVAEDVLVMAREAFQRNASTPATDGAESPLRGASHNWWP